MMRAPIFGERLKTPPSDVIYGMKPFRLLILIVPLLLTACGLSDQQKADYASVQRSGVSPAVYDKMVHGDDLSLYDIKALARAGVNDGVILRYLRDRGTNYYLSSDDVAGLRKAGVSQSIVDYMLQTGQRSGPDVYPVVGVGIGYGPYWGPYWGPPYPYPYWYPYYRRWR
jgi:hypothetical protein